VGLRLFTMSVVRRLGWAGAAMAFCGLLSTTIVSATAAGPVVLREADNGRTVVVAVGTTVLLELFTSASSNDAHRLPRLSETSGASGFVDTFRAAQPGTVQITAPSMPARVEASPCPSPRSGPANPTMCTSIADPVRPFPFTATITVTARAAPVPGTGAELLVVPAGALFIAGIVLTVMAARRRDL
jgi:hypothetical protein